MEPFGSRPASREHPPELAARTLQPASTTREEATMSATLDNNLAPEFTRGPAWIAAPGQREAAL